MMHRRAATPAKKGKTSEQLELERIEELREQARRQKRLSADSFKRLSFSGRYSTGAAPPATTAAPAAPAASAAPAPASVAPVASPVRRGMLLRSFAAATAGVKASAPVVSAENGPRRVGSLRAHPGPGDKPLEASCVSVVGAAAPVRPPLASALAALNAARVPPVGSGVKGSATPTDAPAAAGAEAAAVAVAPEAGKRAPLRLLDVRKAADAARPLRA